MSLSSPTTYKKMKDKKQALKEIKLALPKDIVADIMVLGEYDRIRQRSVTLERRFRLAYKYQVWHNENFIDGIHKELEATR